MASAMSILGMAPLNVVNTGQFAFLAIGLCERKNGCHLRSEGMPEIDATPARVNLRRSNASHDSVHEQSGGDGFREFGFPPKGP
jgi:hypothetical protein